MRLVVTGRDGQLASALAELASPALEVVRVGRPELDFERPERVAATIAALKPDVVVNAAAWTAVDKAEDEPERAFTVNAVAAGEVARGAALAGAPVIQISTDYVFDGRQTTPYGESDPVAPLGVYGRSKLAGERATADANERHVILRLQWLHAARGQNFVRTMLRLAETRDEVGVVADQFGCPTHARDAATIVAGMARALRDAPSAAALRGVFHLGAAGDTVSWADFAEAVFAEAAARGLPHARVRRIGTADYPTRAARPAHSRLDGSKLVRVYGLASPDWRKGLADCLATIAAGG